MGFEGYDGVFQAKGNKLNNNICKTKDVEKTLSVERKSTTMWLEHEGRIKNDMGWEQNVRIKLSHKLP